MKPTTGRGPTKQWSRLPTASAALPLPAAAHRGRSGSSRQGCTSDRVKVPIPSMARFRRLAYPGRGEVTTHERLGRRNHGCHTADTVAGGATWVVSKPVGLNRKKGLQPRKGRRTEVAVWAWWSADLVRTGGRPLSCGTQRVDAPHEPPGVEVQARRERCAERTSGRSSSQQGLTATCKDLVFEGSPEARRGWRIGA